MLSDVAVQACASVDTDAAACRCFWKMTPCRVGCAGHANFTRCGSGGFGIVLAPLSMPGVVVKVLFPRESGEEDLWRREQSYLTVLCPHKCLVAFWGATNTPQGRKCLVFERATGPLTCLWKWKPMGAFCDMVRGALATSDAADEALLHKSLVDVAKGLRHMHAVGLVHRDVKTPNVLVNASGRAVISDLGSTLPAGTQKVCGGGTEMWRAPEQMVPTTVDASGLPWAVVKPCWDVWAFGVLLWQGYLGLPSIEDAVEVSCQLRRAVDQAARTLLAMDLSVPGVLNALECCRATLATAMRGAYLGYWHTAPARRVPSAWELETVGLCLTVDPGARITMHALVARLTMNLRLPSPVGGATGAGGLNWGVDCAASYVATCETLAKQESTVQACLQVAAQSLWVPVLRHAGFLCAMVALKSLLETDEDPALAVHVACHVVSAGCLDAVRAVLVLCKQFPDAVVARMRDPVGLSAQLCRAMASVSLERQRCRWKHHDWALQKLELVVVKPWPKKWERGLYACLMAWVAGEHGGRQRKARACQWHLRAIRAVRQYMSLEMAEWIEHCGELCQSEGHWQNAGDFFMYGATTLDALAPYIGSVQKRRLSLLFRASKCLGTVARAMGDVPQWRRTVEVLQHLHRCIRDAHGSHRDLERKCLKRLAHSLFWCNNVSLALQTLRASLSLKDPGARTPGELVVLAYYSLLAGDCGSAEEAYEVAFAQSQDKVAVLMFVERALDKQLTPELWSDSKMLLRCQWLYKRLNVNMWGRDAMCTPEYQQAFVASCGDFLQSVWKAFGGTTASCQQGSILCLRFLMAIQAAAAHFMVADIVPFSRVSAVAGPAFAWIRALAVAEADGVAGSGEDAARMIHCVLTEFS